MDDYQLLDPTKHASVRIQNQGSLLKLDRGMLAPAFLGEFRSLACEFPIVLTKDGETGQFLCAALLGLSPQHLSCVDAGGEWQDAYLPWSLKRQPFLIANQANQEGTVTPMLSLDTAHPMVSQDSGEPVFDSSGALTDVAEAKLAALRSINDFATKTAEFVDRLMSLELLTGLKVQGQTASGQDIVVDGIYGIDEEALGQLSESVLGELHRANQLEPIYLMVASLGRISAFMRQINHQQTESP